MKARDLAYETFSALDANRGRSLLTVLGIVIGISAVIAMTALIGGVKQAMVGELGLSQARLVYVQCWYNRETRLDDVEAMTTELTDDYEYVLPMTYGSTEVMTDTAKVNGQVYGVTAQYQEAMGMKLVRGRWITEREEETGALAVVLDQAGVKALFGSPDAECVGKSVRIGGVAYAVVGVLESTSIQSNSDFATIYLPFLTCCNRINGYTSVDQIIAFAREGSDMEAVASRTRDWLARHYGVPDEDRESYIWVQTMSSMIEELNSMMLAFQVLMTSVASISLVVGGIGIMNMMLTNVTERIREIGLRKALGAKARDITRQFLLESVCLTLVGGIIGIVLGYLGAFGLAGVAGGLLGYEGEGIAIVPYIDVQSMLLVAGICVAIGIVFGYYPARRAARLDPVESLHYQ